MKILLVYPPFCTPASPPYSITSLYAFLKKNIKEELEVLDLNIEFHKRKFGKYMKFYQNINLDDYDRVTDEYGKLTKKTYSESNKKVVDGKKPELFNELLTEIIDINPDIAAFSIVYSSQAFYAYSLIKELKKIGIKTVIGGPAVNQKLTTIADKSLRNEIELIEYIKCQEFSIQSMTGGKLCVYSSNSCQKIPEHAQEPPDALNDFNIPPVCDWRFLTDKKSNHKDLNFDTVLDFKIYKLNDYFVPEAVIPIRTSSSCYYRQCTFCTHYSNIAYFEFPLDSIKKNITASKAKFIFFTDDMIHKKRLLEIAQILKPLNVSWMCQLRPIKELDYPTLKTLHESGLRMIIWGVESGCDRILKLMRKGTNKNNIIEVLKDSHDAGIKNIVYIMFGFPTETKEEFIETIEFLKQNSQNIDLVSTSVFGLQKGTPIYNNPEEFGIKEIISDKRTILEPKISYKVHKGLTQQEAVRLRENYKKTIEKINKYPKAMNFFREHMLFMG